MNNGYTDLSNVENSALASNEEIKREDNFTRRNFRAALNWGFTMANMTGLIPPELSAILGYIQKGRTVFSGVQYLTGQTNNSQNRNEEKEDIPLLENINPAPRHQQNCCHRVTTVLNRIYNSPRLKFWRNVPDTNISSNTNEITTQTNVITPGLFRQSI